MNTGRAYVTGFGIQTDTIANGGGYPSASNTVKTENYDGTSWTNKPNSANTRWATDSGFGASGPAGGVSGALANGPLTNVSATEEYNKSVNVITGAAWASGGATSHRTGARLNFGTQTEAFSGGGLYVPNPGYTDETKTEEYDGTSWTAGTDMPARKGRGAGFGVLTAGVVCGGTLGNTTQDTTFEYNGSSWTAGGALNVGRRYQSGFGTLTAGAICGGSPSTPNLATETEEYDGTSWTTSGSLNTARQTADAGGGTQTAAITFGGENPGTDKLTNSEEYNGTSWSEGNDLNTGTKRNSGGGTSVPTTLSVGGQSATNPPGTAQVEQYNGTSWVTAASMATARSQIGKMQGNSASGLVNNGANSSDTYITTTEEFTGETSALNVKTITTS